MIEQERIDELLLILDEEKSIIQNYLNREYTWIIETIEAEGPPYQHRRYEEAIEERVEIAKAREEKLKELNLIMHYKQLYQTCNGETAYKLEEMLEEHKDYCNNLYDEYREKAESLGKSLS